MKDDELEQLANQNHLPATKERRYDLKSVAFFIIGMVLVWVVGTILTPILPEEYIVMLLYAIAYFFFGFDPTKWFKKH